MATQKRRKFLVRLGLVLLPIWFGGLLLLSEEEQSPRNKAKPAAKAPSSSAVSRPAPQSPGATPKTESPPQKIEATRPRTEIEAPPPRTAPAGLPAWFSTIPAPTRPTPAPQTPAQPAPHQADASPPPAPTVPAAPEPKQAGVGPSAAPAVPVESSAIASPPTAPVETQPTSPPPAAEGETVSVSERFAGVSAASEFAPPVGWYAPVAAVPMEQNIAIRSELAVKVVPPAGASTEPAKPLTVALSETEVAAISPPRIARPALAPGRATDRQPFASDMVEPPPGTPAAVTGIDPNRLRALMQQGFEAYSAAEDVQQAKGLRLIRIAAALGHEPARSLVAREFPSSRVLRIVIPAAEAVRYSLDEFMNDPISAGAPDGAFVTLAVYFAERQAISLFAGHFLDAIQDDRRLQEDSRLQAILNALARVSGSCAQVARLVALPSARSGPGCPPTLQFYVESHLRAKGSHGRDTSARRQALSQLQALAAAR
jgi:hypothetical protein